MIVLPQIGEAAVSKPTIQNPHSIGCSHVGLPMECPCAPIQLIRQDV